MDLLVHHSQISILLPEQGLGKSSNYVGVVNRSTQYFHNVENNPFNLKLWIKDLFKSSLFALTHFIHLGWLGAELSIYGSHLPGVIFFQKVVIYFLTLRAYCGQICEAGGSNFLIIFLSWGEDPRNIRVAMMTYSLGPLGGRGLRCVLR